MPACALAPPTRFADFVGNAPVVAIVRRALASGRLPHALIFAGPEGVGKRALAGIIARRLNCAAPAEDEPCGQCPSCRKIALGFHPDVRTIEPEGSSLKIDQIRQLSAEVAFKPFEGGCRVAILDSAETMRHEAANSLLKTLEEPASTTYLILVTTSPYALLETIRSRARILHFGAVGPAAIEDLLVARAGLERGAAKMAAEASRGSVAAALTFEPERAAEAREQAFHFVKLLLQRDSFAEMSQLAAAVARDKDGFDAWGDAVDGLLRDVYYAQRAPGRLGPSGPAADVRDLAASVPNARVVDVIEGVRRMRADIDRSANRQLALEATYLRQPEAGARRRST